MSHPTIQTSDVGYLIRDMIENCDIEIVGHDIPQDEWPVLSSIDDTDPNNLICTCSNGQKFTVRIIAKE